MNDKLQKALDYIKKLNIPVDEVLNVGNNLQNTINSFAEKTTKPVGIPLRRQKDSSPVATLKSGQILYSDGTVKDGLASMKLKALKQNVLDQYNWTSQAKQYAQGIELGYDINAKPAPGRIIGGTYQKVDNKPKININAKILDQRTIGLTGPAQTMAHELIHSMDANVNQDNMQSFSPQGENSGDSYGFYNNFIKGGSKGIKEELDGFLSAYSKDENTQDIESFAQFGAPRGEKVMKTPAEKFYNNIFVKGSKSPLNYTPMFPIRDPYANMTSALEEEDF